MYSKTVEITSSVTTFDVDIANDLGIKQLDYDMSVAIEVEFTDKLTAQLASAYTQMELIFNINRVTIETPDHFNPGLPVTYKVMIQKYDGSPAPANSKFTVMTSFDYESLTTTNATFTLDNTGTKEIVIANVPSNATHIQITVNLNKA